MIKNIINILLVALITISSCTQKQSESGRNQQFLLNEKKDSTTMDVSDEAPIEKIIELDTTTTFGDDIFFSIGYRGSYPVFASKAENKLYQWGSKISLIETYPDNHKPVYIDDNMIIYSSSDSIIIETDIEVLSIKVSGVIKSATASKNGMWVYFVDDYDKPIKKLHLPTVSIRNTRIRGWNLAIYGDYLFYSKDHPSSDHSGFVQVFSSKLPALNEETLVMASVFDEGLTFLPSDSLIAVNANMVTHQYQGIYNLNSGKYSLIKDIPFENSYPVYFRSERIMGYYKPKGFKRYIVEIPEEYAMASELGIKDGSEIKSHFEEFSNSLPEIELPFSKDCNDEDYNLSRIELDKVVEQLFNPNQVSILGKFSTQNGIAVIHVYPADVLLPIVSTYTKEGYKVSELKLFDSYCGRDYDFMSKSSFEIRENYVITLTDSTESYTMDENDNITATDSSTSVSTYYIDDSGIIQKMNPDFEITTIDGFPEDLIGCSCYFSTNDDDLENEKYIYLNDYGDVEVISIDDREIRIDLSNPKQNIYRVEIETIEEEQVGQELIRKKGTLKIIGIDGSIKSIDFVGECGC